MNVLRYGHRFAPDGGTGAALFELPDGAVEVELWSRRPDGWHTCPTGLGIDRHDQLLPLSGRLVVCVNRGDTHDVVLIDSAGARPCVTLSGPSVRLLPPPPGDTDTLASALVRDGERTRLCHLTDTGVLRWSAVSSGGTLEDETWLDGHRLAATLSDAGEGSRVVTLDVDTGRTEVSLDVGAETRDRLLGCSIRSGLMVVSTDAGDASWVGFRRAGDAEFWFPDELAGDEPADVFAIDPTGRQVLLHRRRGALADLTVFDVDSETVVPLDIPAGRPRGRACWTEQGILLPWSDPHTPYELLTALPGQPRQPGRRSTRPPDVQLVTLPGADGSCEAVVYGSGDWWRTRHLVIALHGGPHDQWGYDHQPLLSALAGDEVAVVALNQRGSVGYGRSYAAAIHGAWAGPDLDDVVAVIDHLSRLRSGLRPPTVLGASYGGFLALLAAAVRGERLHGCVALCPFSSAARLHTQASPEVRAMIEDLGGLEPVNDALGPRDLVRLADRITTRVLLIHGTDDDVIPVAESRLLHRRLTGRELDGVGEVDYLELADAGHHLTNGPALRCVTPLVREFLIGRR